MGRTRSCTRKTATLPSGPSSPMSDRSVSPSRVLSVQRLAEAAERRRVWPGRRRAEPARQPGNYDAMIQDSCELLPSTSDYSVQTPKFGVGCLISVFQRARGAKILGSMKAIVLLEVVLAVAASAAD